MKKKLWSLALVLAMVVLLCTAVIDDYQEVRGDHRAVWEAGKAVEDEANAAIYAALVLEFPETAASAFFGTTFFGFGPPNQTHIYDVYDGLTFWDYVAERYS